jgi:hypothetical protein
MPTVMRFGALRVVVYPGDHRPAHVHIIGPGCEAVFNLNCPEGPPELRESFGFRMPDLGPIIDSLQLAITELCRKWREIHGAY